MEVETVPIYRYVVRWYDRRTRNWVVQVLDADRNQIGDAEYSATEKEATSAQRYHRGANLAFGRVVTEKLKPDYA